LRLGTLFFVSPLPSLQALVAAGADVHAITSVGATALHYATSPEVIRSLIVAGASVNSRTQAGVSPLIALMCLGRHSARLQESVSGMAPGVGHWLGSWDPGPRPFKLGQRVALCISSHIAAEYLRCVDIDVGVTFAGQPAAAWAAKYLDGHGAEQPEAICTAIAETVRAACMCFLWASLPLMRSSS
jgi:hypothetical protein